MPKLIPSLFQLIGEGFVDDAYAADGNHLRWFFDPRLGLPRFAFCLERRAGLGTERALVGLSPLRERFIQAQGQVREIVRPGVSVRRPRDTLFISTGGIRLSDSPLLLDFHGGSDGDPEPYACWVLLEFRLGGQGARLRADAEYENRGEFEVVDRQRISGQQSNAFVRVTLRSDRIDRVAVTGRRARLVAVEWVRTEDLMAAQGWEPVACFPIATTEPDYRARNEEHLDGATMKELAFARILKPLPHGAEPLDEHQVPPSRPPTEEELVRRYLNPWMEYLEPWVRQVLSESLAADLHQEEVRRVEPLTEFSQARGVAPHAGVPGMADRTMEVRPYNALLAASSVYTVARLLGLAAVDQPPPVQDVDIWDYRVRGRWRVPDVVAWMDKLRRERDVLRDQLQEATPDERSRLLPRFLNKWFEMNSTTVFLNELLSETVDDTVELWALELGVQATQHDLFAAPADLQATFDGLGLPHSSADPDALEGVARLEWALRRRSRPIFDAEIPMAAAIGRDGTGGSGAFPEMLNPRHPDLEVAAAIVPAGPPGAPGQDGTASFVDRHAESDTDYRYGVSEVDPFGRWSPFRETLFRWEYDIPPAAPVQVGADLDLAGSPTSLRLTVRFAWPTDLHPAQDHSFDVHLRRLAPPSGSPNDRIHWGHLERQPGSGADPFRFSGVFSGSDTHDGMPVTVALSDRTVTDPAGNVRAYRDYTVTFTGLVVDRDAIERAQVWVSVSSVDEAHGMLESPEVGGPARAEHILAAQPQAAALPPDPEQATFADAQGVSSYTLEWQGAPNVRYSVYRAGERELVAHLRDKGLDTSAYDPEDPPNFRAQALKLFAVQARDAFQPRSGLVPEPPRYPPDFEPASLRGEFLEPTDWEDPALGGGPLLGGPRSFTDALPGKLRTLSVYAVLGRSRSGVLSEWPTSGDGFAVVAVPRAPEPARPVAIRASWQPPVEPPPLPPEAGAERVELYIAEPPAQSAAVASYEVYRTLDPAKSGDYRRMRPLHRLDAPVYDANVPGLEGTPVVIYVDPTISPWRTYYYRVVARAPGLDGAAAGMRSQASSLVEVSTLSASPPPAPREIQRVQDGDKLQVFFTAETPTVSAGTFFFDLIHLASRGPLIVARVAAAAARQADPDRYLIEVDGLSLSPADQIAVRITDPLGQSTDSAPFSVAEPPDLVNLRVRRIVFLNLLTVQVHSSAPTAKPEMGVYVLELFKERGASRELVARARLHEIGTVPFGTGFVRAGTDATGRNIYRVRLGGSSGSIDRVLVRLTDPNGLRSELRSIV